MLKYDITPVKNKNDLKNEAEDIVNKLYNLRYGYSLIKEEDIKRIEKNAKHSYANRVFVNA